MIISIFIVFFALVFAVTALMMYLDTRTLVARPPKLTVAEGTAEASTDQASATHDEDAKTGRMRVQAVLNGAGQGQASATLGHEFAVRGKKAGRYYVVVEYEQQAEARVADGEGSARAVLDLRIGEKQATITETRQDGRGDRILPEQGEVVKTSKKVLTNLKPGPSRIVVCLSAVAEQTGSGSANCRAEAQVKVTAITVKPTLGSLFL
jgi:hypothetical protein